jgi:hypothetical protein
MRVAGLVVLLFGVFVFVACDGSGNDGSPRYDVRSFDVEDSSVAHDADDADLAASTLDSSPRNDGGIFVDSEILESGSGDAGPEAIQIRFAAKLGNAPLACGQSYSNQGTTGVTATPQDFRFKRYASFVLTARRSACGSMRAHPFKAKMSLYSISQMEKATAATAERF